MKRQHAILILLAILVLGVVVFLRAPEHDLVLPEHTPAASDVPVPAPTAPTEDEHLGPVSEAQDIEALESLPEMQAYRQRQNFEQAMRRFFDEAASMSPEERAAQAAALLAQIDTFEQSGELSAAEAVTLRLGLLRESHDEQGFAEESAQVLADYQARYEASMEQFIAAQPPEFVEYKSRERDIVREVQQMEHFPEGMSRGQYLRERLQAAREESYAR